MVGFLVVFEVKAQGRRKTESAEYRGCGYVIHLGEWEEKRKTEKEKKSIMG